MTKGAAVIFGSGPGIGVNVGKIFAENGFSKVILLSRNEERLKQDASQVQEAAPEVKVMTLSVDLDDTSNVQNTLKKVDSHLQDVKLEFILYNAARIGPSKMFEFSVEQYESDLRV
jgi:short-subunit dehydrogenase